MQTLGAIVMSSDLENYYQAVYLLEFLHGLYPNVISIQQYSELLVYLKSQAVIYVACCYPVSDRIQAARGLINQLFDNYSCGSGDHTNKMVLENAHKVGSATLKNMLSNGKRLSLAGLSVQPLTKELYKKMCGILKEFLEGIDNKLPLPTIVQLINNHLRKHNLTSNSEQQTPHKKPSLADHPQHDENGPSSTRQTEDLPSSQSIGSNLNVCFTDYVDVSYSNTVNDKDCQPSSHSTQSSTDQFQPKAPMLTHGRGRKKTRGTPSLRAKPNRRSRIT
ncbi:uncharacterized protein [Dysidea avara]